MAKLFDSPFHLLLIVSQCLLQSRDNAAVSIATVIHSKVYHVHNEAFIIKFSCNYYQCQGTHIQLYEQMKELVPQYIFNRP